MATPQALIQAITPDTLIGDIVEQHPEVIETLLSYGVHCIGCHVSPYESIGDGFRGHGMGEEEINKALVKLNEVILKSKPSNGRKGGRMDDEMADGMKGGTAGLTGNGHTDSSTGAGTVIGTVIVTDKAAAKIKEALMQNNKKALRLSVKSGGCSGFTYALEVDDQANADDLVLTEKGVQLFIDQASLSKLNGITIDYVEGLQASGFKFSNPQAQHNCGCGKSFG